MGNAAKNIIGLMNEIANLEKKLQNLTISTYRNALDVLQVAEIDFIVEPTEQYGVSFNRVMLVSVGGMSNGVFLDKLVRGNDPVVDTIRDIFYQDYRNGDAEAYDLIAKDKFLQHILHRKIDFDTAIDALMSVSYLDGRILIECLYGLRK
jgi:hypothetical protein